MEIVTNVIIVRKPMAEESMSRCMEMDDKRTKSYMIGYGIGQQIREYLMAILGLTILVFIWIIPIWLFEVLGIGYS